jgi:hypothetical protein
MLLMDSYLMKRSKFGVCCALVAFSWGFFFWLAPVKMHLHRRCVKFLLTKIPEPRISGSLGLFPSHISLNKESFIAQGYQINLVYSLKRLASGRSETVFHRPILSGSTER